MKINKSSLNLAIYILAIIFLGFSIFRIFSMPSEKNMASTAALFESTMNNPEGKPQSLKQFQNKIIVLNFWATWCAPCVEELPMLDAFFSAEGKSGWQVLGLAVDKPKNVQEFLQKMPLHFPLAVDALQASQWARQLGNLSGGLPFTVALNAAGEVIQRKMGKLSATDLASWREQK